MEIMLVMMWWWWWCGGSDGVGGSGSGGDDGGDDDVYEKEAQNIGWELPPLRLSARLLLSSAEVTLARRPCHPHHHLIL